MDFGADYSEYSVTDNAKRVAFLTYLMKFLESRKRHCEYNCDVDKFFLRMTLEDSCAKVLVKKWICFALEEKVKSLFLGLKMIYRNHYYLRDIAFCDTTLVDLTISGCEITNCSFKLPALKFIFLFVVCIEDDDFKNLIASCPRIQNMDLCEVEITSTTTVRELILCKAYDQEILIHFIKKFPLLEKLIIDDCSKLQNLHLSQSNLVSLVMMDCIVRDEVRINSPKLKSLEFKGCLTKFEGIEDLQELEFIQLYLDPSCAHSKHLSLICYIKEVIIIPKYVRPILSVNDIEHLELEIISHHCTFEEVIDDFIWILPDLKTLSLTLGSTTKFFEFSREDNLLSAKEVNNPKPDKRRRKYHRHKKHPKQPKNSVDKISNLPIEIIREIHSRLPWKDLVKTKYSVTDKAKRDAFLTYLIKSLDIHERPSEYNCAVENLLLRMTVENSSAELLVNKWISFAFENKVKMLCLSLKTISRDHYYLSGVAFCADTLVDLTITDCEIKNCSYMLPSLRFLFLFAVCIEDRDFKDLIAGCPRIEQLCVQETAKLHTIVVSNPNLEFFGVHLPCSNGKIRIESANLDSLEFISFSMDMCEVGITSTTTKLVIDGYSNLCEVEITSKPTVRGLTLCNINDEDSTLIDIDDKDLTMTWMNFVDKFPLLEKLIIDDCSMLQELHISQPNLVSLVLKDSIVRWEVRIDSPKLKSLEYKGDLTYFKGIEDLQELEFIRLYLDPSKLHDYWYSWFRDMLESCAHSKCLSLICDIEEVTLSSPLFLWDSPVLHMLTKFLNCMSYCIFLMPNSRTLARRSYIVAFDGCQVVLLVPVEVTNLLPVNDIKNLELEIISQHGTFEEVINDFIWILPYLKTLSLTLGSTTKFIEDMSANSWRTVLILLGCKCFSYVFISVSVIVLDKLHIYYIANAVFVEENDVKMVSTEVVHNQKSDQRVCFLLLELHIIRDAAQNLQVHSNAISLFQ
ncbi:hypothetical protein H5410_038279, partial [Solanum commersonii]